MADMYDVIPPVDRELILQELTKDKFMRMTKNGSNELYIVDAANSPNIMREIGRLRELSFRDAGGGTGEELDIDESDIHADGYKQLIVWDPQEVEILGGYRFIVSNATDTKYLSTEHYFEFSDKFRQEYLPYMIELGRSFVQPKYQGRRGNPKGLFALDNLWDGLGALLYKNPSIKYFFGKVTMYVEYNTDARNKLIYFLKKYFPDRDNLVRPIYPIEINMDIKAMRELFCGADFAEDYKILIREIRSHGENIPPLINSYMNLSPSMKVFGTVMNPDFGGVEETGILITINDIYEQKKERHITQPVNNKEKEPS